ncbi:metal-dependent transcriptional regulator [Citricoccus sp. SGAir0253]|uniref:metal-dependent transcriptional regulator n=1 Tax=Citricoccus sp. SGAir0253 TaxID=2567881 RepID=UPI0010CCF60A|nr:metal-dependent transcriptional regulator [Citricoccus sp. SGAir0253]QCU79119.1 metal-dependent transcriptional regulator [Citricoccus sp. SGAir0253]
MDPSDLTPVAQDYLKVIWSATEWGDPPITTSELAARFGTSAPNVTDTVKRLAAQGLVDYRPYRPVALTPRGRDYAVAMVRRHRLLEAFLVATLGYSWEEVHDEAERLEHAASDALVQRIDAVLGHPDRDPHGDPIPSADGRVHRPEGVLRLGAAAPGTYEVLRLSDADPGRLERFRRHRLTPGAVVEVLHRSADAVTIRAGAPVGSGEPDDGPGTPAAGTVAPGAEAVVAGADAAGVLLRPVGGSGGEPTGA